MKDYQIENLLSGAFVIAATFNDEHKVFLMFLGILSVLPHIVKLFDDFITKDW